MRYSSKFIDKLINKQLASFNTSLEKIEEENKNAKNPIPYWGRFSFITKEQYDKYYEWAIKEMIKDYGFDKDKAEEEYKFLSMGVELAHEYIYDKPTVAGEQLKIEI